MKICVQGLWHLGSVTAACLARAGFSTFGLDADAEIVGRLAQGHAPLFEPGLDALIQDGLAAGRLSFGTDPAAVSEADLVWVTFDTPVDEEDRADAGGVVTAVESLFPLLKEGAVVLISAQVPVGTTRILAAASPRSTPADASASPIRRKISGSARRSKCSSIRADHRRLRRCHDPRRAGARAGALCDRLIWVSIESAEVAKHGVNAFLAVSVTFMNELATLCEQVGADAAEVEQALRSEPRIGAPRLYPSRRRICRRHAGAGYQ
ncbi:MAG: hypothetical protein WDN69_30090 [Aliidongia sp.]